MTKGVKILIGIAVVVVLVILGIVAVVSSYDLDSITVSKAQIDIALQEKLPITKNVVLYDVKIANADLDLSEGAIGILVNIEIDKTDVSCGSTDINLRWKAAQNFVKTAQAACNNMSTETTTVAVLAVGAIDYRRPAFYFSPDSPDDVQIQTEFTDAFLIKHKQKVDIILQKAVFVYLNNLPVFKFKKDATQTIISMAIESVEVHQDSLTVNVSYMALTKTLIGYAIMLIISLIVGVVMIRVGLV